MSVLPVNISPVLNPTQYAAVRDTYLLPASATNEIQPNIVYRSNGVAKFLLLPNVLSAASCFKATLALKDAGFQKGSRRAPIKQRNAQKLTVGWFKQPSHPTYKNMRTAPTLEQPELLASLYPLVMEMDSLVERHLPPEHDFAVQQIPHLWRPDDQQDDLSRIKNPHHYKIVDALDPWQTYTIRGTIFTTLELNRNIIFTAHEDGNNVDGTMACLAAFGTFAGGRLVFPRYGYAATLGVRDLLICDTNYELHGNLGPIVGERFSVVAFMHSSLFGKTTVTGKSYLKQKTVPART